MQARWRPGTPVSEGPGPSVAEAATVASGFRRKIPRRPAGQLCSQIRERGSVGSGPRPYHQIPVRLPFPQIQPPYFLEPPPQTIAGHRGGLKPGNDQSHPGVARCVAGPDHLQRPAPASATRQQAVADISGTRQAKSPRESPLSRQRLPCLDGMETVSRFRPFLRRRDSTARPQRVAMRERKPCLFMRFLLRGRYVGFILVVPPMSRGNYLRKCLPVKVDFSTSDR